jgi:hypothetical protein
LMWRMEARFSWAQPCRSARSSTSTQPLSSALVQMLYVSFVSKGMETCHSQLLPHAAIAPVENKIFEHLQL